MTTIYVVTTRYDGGWGGGFYDKNKAQKLADKLEEERAKEYRKMVNDGRASAEHVEILLAETKYLVIEREVE